MAKRFTATEKWDDPWFHELDDKGKLAWIWLLDKCNHAGIWDVNMKLIEFYVGASPTVDWFHGKVKQLPNGKWFIPKFIEFQYGRLRNNNSTHISVLRILEENGLTEYCVVDEKEPQNTQNTQDVQVVQDVHQMHKNVQIKPLYKGLYSPWLGAKDKDKDKVKDVVFDFEVVWKKYPKRIGRKLSERYFSSSVKTEVDFKNIQLALANYLQSKTVKDGFIQNASTWFNNWRDWIEAVPEPTETLGAPSWMNQ